MPIESLEKVLFLELILDNIKTINEKKLKIKTYLDVLDALANVKEYTTFKKTIKTIENEIQSLDTNFKIEALKQMIKSTINLGDIEILGHLLKDLITISTKVNRKNEFIRLVYSLMEAFADQANLLVQNPLFMNEFFPILKEWLNYIPDKYWKNSAKILLLNAFYEAARKQGMEEVYNGGLLNVEAEWLLDNIKKIRDPFSKLQAEVEFQHFLLVNNLSDKGTFLKTLTSLLEKVDEISDENYKMLFYEKVVSLIGKINPSEEEVIELEKILSEITGNISYDLYKHYTRVKIMSRLAIINVDAFWDKYKKKIFKEIDALHDENYKYQAFQYMFEKIIPDIDEEELVFISNEILKQVNKKLSNPMLKYTLLMKLQEDLINRDMARCALLYNTECHKIIEKHEDKFKPDQMLKNLQVTSRILELLPLDYDLEKHETIADKIEPLKHKLLYQIYICNIGAILGEHEYFEKMLKDLFIKVNHLENPLDKITTWSEFALMLTRYDHQEEASEILNAMEFELNNFSSAYEKSQASKITVETIIRVENAPTDLVMFKRIVNLVNDITVDYWKAETMKIITKYYVS